jgi:hypothetical protein
VGILVGHCRGRKGRASSVGMCSARHAMR